MKRIQCMKIVFCVLLSSALIVPPLDGAILEIGSGHNYATVTDALVSATDGDTLIVFGTITDYNITVSKHVTIRGENPLTSIIQASETGAEVGRRVFLLSPGYQILLQNLTIQHGNSNENGAGIYSQAELSVRNCIIRKNSGVRGGGVYSKSGMLTIVGCDIRENSSQYDGAGVCCRDGNLTIENTTIAGNSMIINSSFGGGLYMSASADEKILTMANCTISGNVAGLATGSGGGIALVALSAASAEQASGKLTASIVNVTLAENSCGGVGKGVFAQATDTSFEAGVVNLTLTNCILDNGLADNFATSGGGVVNVTRTYSIFRDASFSAVGDGNANDTNPLLGALSDNGGLGKTHALLAGSPAINAGTAIGAPLTDQRGYTRVGSPDMGAFETQEVPVSISPNTVLASGGQTILFNVNITNVEAMRGFDVHIQFEPTHFTQAIFTEGAFLSSSGDLTFWQQTGDNGLYRVNCAILGSTAGKSGSGTLFTIALTTAANVPGGLINPEDDNLTLPEVVLRDVNNNPIPGTTVGGTKIVIDIAAPGMEPISEPQLHWYRSAPVLSSLVFKDNYNLQRIEYKIDDGGWTILADNINDSLYQLTNWSVPSFAGLAESVAGHSIRWRASDDLNQQAGDADWMWSFKKDVTEPQGALSIAFSQITPVGMTVTGATAVDAIQGEEYYEFDCKTDEQFDKIRTLNAAEMSCTGMTPNSPYTFRYRVSDGVADDQVEPPCNTTAWSEDFSTYTLSVAPTDASVTCDKSGVVNTSAFTFTAVGGFGPGTVEYYHVAWDNSATHTWTGAEVQWQDSTMTFGAVLANTDYYLHVQGYNAQDVSNGTMTLGPYQWNGTPITPVSNLHYVTAGDSANAIFVDWVNPSDAEMSGVELWVKGFGGYPMYSGFTPSMPSSRNSADTNGWSLIYSGSDTHFEFSPEERDFYYCAIFVKDMASHYSGAICDSALSYWLGDVDATPDGDVDLDDIHILRNALGASSGDARWNAACDVGPTLKRSRLGRPAPDSVVDLEDVMIFSMNYDNTTDSSQTPETPALSSPVVVKLTTWIENNQLYAQLDLASNPAAVKGLSFCIDLNGLSIDSFEIGSIWGENDFFETIVSDDQVKFYGAALGHEAVLQGNGYIGRARLNVLSQNVECTLSQACARTVANTPIDVSIE